MTIRFRVIRADMKVFALPSHEAWTEALWARALEPCPGPPVSIDDWDREVFGAIRRVEFLGKVT